MKIKLSLILSLGLILGNCAFKDSVKRQSIGGSQMIIYEAHEISLFKDVKNLQPSCINGVRKAGASKVIGTKGDKYSYDDRIFSSSSQQTFQSSMNSSKPTTAPSYTLKCTAIGIQ